MGAVLSQRRHPSDDVSQQHWEIPLNQRPPTTQRLRLIIIGLSNMERTEPRAAECGPFRSLLPVPLSGGSRTTKRHPAYELLVDIIISLSLHYTFESKAHTQTHRAGTLHLDLDPLEPSDMSLHFTTAILWRILDKGNGS
ncbi:hypothetical protein KQX54_007190 [Cotesia glomerata]|uniref:Uncharacterized protein n=1 Tax=Cotesia glomerata TaxID=32391 RepID=A0AAV7I7U0_COTGL|nr:hypothetical protein KQX54_007190 [Cotesia glomerata]